MLHMMVDIETMGKGATGAIAQIGYAVFDPTNGRIHGSRDINVNLKSSVEFGMTMDPDTVYWWLAQSQEARAALAHPTPMDLPTALGSLCGAYKDCEAIWAFPASFDIVILDNAFGFVAGKSPWHYREIRDARTWIRQAMTREECVKSGVEHLASADCLNQINWLMEASRRLGITPK